MPKLIVRFRWIAFLMIAIEVAILVVGASQLNLQDYLQQTLLWVQSLGAIGAIVFIAIYSLATVLFVPGSLLTLGGGALFGVVLGSLYVFVGAVIGATLAFLLGRYLVRGWVLKRLANYPTFTAIDDAIAREGLKIVILTRLSPVFPFTLLNYALGVTQVSLKDYLLGFLGMLPGTVMYVYLGSLAGSLATLSPSATPQNETIQWVVRIVGFIATVTVTVYITRIARQALNDRLTPPETNKKP